MSKQEKDFIWPQGIKKTKQREQILTILRQSKTPMTARDIFSETEKQGKPVWLSTIYRILETLTEKSVILKTTVLENEMAIYEFNAHDHKHYAVCIDCHKVISLENCPLEGFVPRLKESNFHVLGHKLEVFGYCNDCMAHHLS